MACYSANIADTVTKLGKKFPYIVLLWEQMSYPLMPAVFVGSGGGGNVITTPKILIMPNLQKKL